MISARWLIFSCFSWNECYALFLTFFYSDFAPPPPAAATAAMMTNASSLTRLQMSLQGSQCLELLHTLLARKGELSFFVCVSWVMF